MRSLRRTCPHAEQKCADLIDKKGSEKLMRTQSVRRSRSNGSQDQRIRMRHMQRQKIHRRNMLIARSVLTVTAAAALLLAVIFLTPLFNVRSVTVLVNDRIPTEQIYEYLADINGENLFKVNTSYVKEKLSRISYVEDTLVEKKYFPAAVTITITEKKPYAYVMSESGYEIIDENCVVLESVADEPQDIPELTYYHESFDALAADEEACAQLYSFFEICGRIDIMSHITSVELKEFNEIDFVYDDRIDVICGSSVDMEQKLRLFKATVNNSNMANNIHGTMDLSTTGKATLQP